MRRFRIFILAAALAGFGMAPALATTKTGDPTAPGYNKTVVKKKTVKKKQFAKKATNKKKMAKVAKRTPTPPANGAKPPGNDTSPPGNATPPGSTTSN